MSGLYEYLVRHTHRTWFGLRRRHGRTLLSLAKPIDSNDALVAVEHLLAEQLRIHPSDLAITAYTLVSATTGSTHDDLALPTVAEAVAASTKQIADRLLASVDQYQAAWQKLTATDIGLYRARAALEGLSQQHGPHGHVGRHRDSELGQMLHLVRGELANYPRIFPEGLATPLAVERVMRDTAPRWERTCLNMENAKHDPVMG